MPATLTTDRAVRPELFVPKTPEDAIRRGLHTGSSAWAVAELLVSEPVGKARVRARSSHSCKRSEVRIPNFARFQTERFH